MKIKQFNQNNNWVQLIKNKLYSHNGIVQKLKSPFVGLSQYTSQKENVDSKKINSQRENHYEMIRLENQKSAPNFNQVTKKITKDTRKFVQNMINEEVNKLGKPPCDFSVVTLGSMARNESGPITDLEVGFIVKEKNIENYRYFYRLGQQLSDRLFLLGEHPDIGEKGLRIDEADNAPPHKKFFARNTRNDQAKRMAKDAIKYDNPDKEPYEGSRPFLATAEEFANYSKPLFEQDKVALNKIRRQEYKKELTKAFHAPKNKDKVKSKEGREEIKKEVKYWIDQLYLPLNEKELETANDAGKTLGRNVDLLHGDLKLYNQFQSIRQKHFDQKQKNGKTFRQNFAKEKMLKALNDQEKKNNLFITGTLGKTLDIKRELYRFAEQFITNLGFYHQCASQNTVDIVHELMDRKVLSPNLSSKLLDYLQFATGLRLKEQSVLKRQGFEAYFSQKSFNEDKTAYQKDLGKLKDGIKQLEKAKANPSKISEQKRELVKLQDEYHHFLDMAPKNLYTHKDFELLKNKYAPMAKEIFNAAKQWHKGKDQLGFDFTSNPNYFKSLQKGNVKQGILPSFNLLQTKAHANAKDLAAHRHFAPAKQKFSH